MKPLVPLGNKALYGSGAAKPDQEEYLRLWNYLAKPLAN